MKNTPHPTCDRAGCNAPEGECSGACLKTKVTTCCTSTAATANGPQTLRLSDIERAVAELEALSVRGKDWMLVAPDGRAWKAPPEERLKVLILNHSMPKFQPLSEMHSTMGNDNQEATQGARK